MFFDAATTKLRAKLLHKAIAAGKHIYCEKPTAENLQDAVDLARAAKKAGIKHGVVQDKLFLPGLLKLKTLIDSGFFGRILSVRGEFGYWVFEGDWQPAQRPSWNYRKKDGGGIILDMLCHWRYVLDNLFGEVQERLLPRRDAHPQALGRERQALQGRRRRRRLCHVPARRRRHRPHQLLLVRARAPRRSCHLPRRWHAWLRRRRAAEMLEPGAREHAAAGVESGRAAADQFLRDLGRGARQRQFDNGFKTEWEMFIRHVFDDAPFKWTLREGAKGVQLAEAGLRSWKERRWIDIPPLKV